MTAIYTAALTLLLLRRQCPYILRRTPLMLTISLLGNLLQSLTCLSQLEDLSESLSKDPSSDCFLIFRIRQSANLFFHYLMFFPYILRVYRLSLIFKLDKNWDYQEFSFKKNIHRTKQAWMLWVLVLLMLPFVALVVIIMKYCDFASYLPASESDNEALYSQSSYLLICFIEQLLFILSIYSLREVSDDYSMTKELTVTMVCWFMTPMFTVFPINFGRYKAVPSLLRNFILFIVSFCYPIFCSFRYKFTSDTVTLEMLESLELILLSKMSLEYFEEYLRVNEGKNNESCSQCTGYELLQLYMKCENYLNFPQFYEVDELVEELLRSDAVPMSYACDSKESLEDHIMRSKDALLKIITEEYFINFKKSRQYTLLQRIVHRQEIYTGRLITIGLTESIYSDIKNMSKSS